MQTESSDWFDRSVLDAAGAATRTDAEWIEQVVQVWGARYEARVDGSALQLVTQQQACYLMEVDLHAGWARTVVAVARLRPVEHDRDRSYQAGFPLNPPPGRARDRGHLIPNSGAGEYGPNLFPQDRALNRGWSFEGRRFRAVERHAVRSGALYFCGLDYCDGGDVPAVVTTGVLDEREWIVDVYRNRFDAVARGAFPDSTRPTDLDSLLRRASSATVGDLGEEIARAYLESERGQLIVDLDDAQAPRHGTRHGIDIVAVDEGELIAYEVKTRLRAKRRRTRDGDLVTPRLGRAGRVRQASQQYVIPRLVDHIDIAPDTAVTVRLLVVDLVDLVVQEFDVAESGRPARPLTSPTSVREHAETALDVLLERPTTKRGHCDPAAARASRELDR